MLSSSILDEIKQDLATYQFTTAAQSIPNQPNQQIYVDSLVCPQGFRPCDSVKQRCPVENATPEIYTNEGLRCYTNVALDKLEAEEQDKPAPDLLTLLTQTERLLDISAQEKPAPPVQLQTTPMRAEAQEKPVPPVQLKTTPMLVPVKLEDAKTTPMKPKGQLKSAKTTPMKPTGQLKRHVPLQKKAKKNDAPKKETEKNDAPTLKALHAKLGNLLVLGDKIRKQREHQEKTEEHLQPDMDIEKEKEGEHFDMDIEQGEHQEKKEEHFDMDIEKEQGEQQEKKEEQLDMDMEKENEEKEEVEYQETKEGGEHQKKKQPDTGVDDFTNLLDKLSLKGGFNYNLVSIASDMFSLYIRIVDMLKDNDDISWNNIIDVCKALTKTNRHLNPLLDADSIDALSKHVQRAFTS